MEAGLGELDIDGLAVLSGTTGTPRREAGMPAVSDERLRACAKALIPDPRGMDCGEGGGSISPSRLTGVPGTGDADSEPALKGWNDVETEGRLASAAFSTEMSDALEDCAARGFGAGDGGELVSEPIVFTARKADIGLDPPGRTLLP